MTVLDSWVDFVSAMVFVAVLYDMTARWWRRWGRPAWVFNVWWLANGGTSLWKLATGSADGWDFWYYAVPFPLELWMLARGPEPRTVVEEDARGADVVEPG